MARQTINNVKLGVFVVTGLLLLIFALYMIGRNRNLFTANFQLKVRFRNAEGLMPGNNVRYAGIQTGTVKKISIINDTTIEVTMLISEATRNYIRKSSVVSIGTEGLMGNKVVNIVPGKAPAPAVSDGDILPASPQTDIGDAIGTLYQTNNNIAIVAEELVQTIRSINSSPALRHLLEDTSLPASLSTSSAHIMRSSARIEAIVAGLGRGQGAAGVLLSDTAAQAETAEALDNIHLASRGVRTLVARLDSIAGTLQAGLDKEGNALFLLLKDTASAGRLGRSLENLERGTQTFSEDMEALQHNFLLRGYFRKKDKREQ